MALEAFIGRTNIQFADKENVSTLTVYFPAGALVFETYVAWVTQTLVPALKAVTNAVIPSFEVIREYRETDPAALIAPEYSEVQRKLIFSFEVEGGGVSTFAIPSVLNELIVDGTPFADPNNAAIAAVVQAFVDNGVTDLLNLRNFRGDQLRKLSRTPYKKHQNRKTLG